METTKQAMLDRVKLPLTFDVQKMAEEVQALNLERFVYYDVQPLRSPAHFVDPSLPLPPPADDYADGSWTDWKNTILLEKLPYIHEIMKGFQEHTKVNLVRLLRLSPGAVVKEHTDPTLGLHIEKSVVRLTIPILTNDETVFYLNRKPVDMKPGQCWYLRLTDPHMIENHGATERINLTLDMIPNDWVRSLIKN
ncbi:MAG: aspartyl/asparaginyl beta-hydroxylase domain-containing protein [Flavobacteriaceae bacterium]|nr:aspartyl/asparaginyl beta-hydroxylase domain-containing protein [Flavobacteriaceae bacterium]